MDDRHAEPDLPARRAGDAGLSRRRLPDRLPGLVDSHAHLQHPRFDADRDAVIERAAAAGVERILVPGWDLASSEAALALADRHPGTVVAAVGIHPHQAAGMTPDGWRTLEGLVADPRTAAVGEIGLDFFRNLSAPDVQREALERQLGLAAARGLPVLVHDRDAHEAVSAALLAAPIDRAGGARGVLHAFSGDAAMAGVLVEAGYLVSFALPVAFRSAAGPRAAAAAVPAGRLLVETDAPYLGPDRDGRNDPTTVIRVVAELARLRGESVEAVVAGLRATFDRLVGSPWAA